MIKQFFILITFISVLSITIHANEGIDKFEILNKNITPDHKQLKNSYNKNIINDVYIFDDNIKEKSKEIVVIKKQIIKKVVTVDKPEVKQSPPIVNVVIPLEEEAEVIIAPKDGITLKQAILKAVSRNEKIVSLQQKVIQAKRIVDQKYAGLFPMINIIANSGPNEIKTEDEVEKGRFSKGDMQVSLTQNLYAGGKTTNDIKMVKENLKVALAKYQINLEKEILSIIDSYLNLVYEKKSIEQNRENIISLTKILNIVTIKEQNGAATKGDLNYIKSNIENVKSELILAEAKYKNSISYYEYFVGDIKNSNYPIQEQFNISVNPNAKIEKLISKNPALLEIQANMVKYKYDLESKKARFKPTIDLILTDKYAESSDEGVASTDKKTAVLSLNYAIYNGGRDKAILFEAKSKIDEYKYKYLDKKKSLMYNAIQIFNNLNSSGKSLKHIENEVEANSKVVKSYWTSFKYGNQDLQALLLAQRSLNTAKLNKIQNRKSYISQYFQLLSSVGSLLKYMGLENIVSKNSIIQKARLSILRSNLND